MMKNYAGQKRERDTEDEAPAKGTNRIVNQGTKEHYVLKRISIWANGKDTKNEKMWNSEKEVSAALDFDAKATISTLHRERFLDSKGVKGDLVYRLAPKGMKALIDLENDVRSKAKNGQWKQIREEKQKEREAEFESKEAEKPTTVVVDPQADVELSTEISVAETKIVESEVTEPELEVKHESEISETMSETTSEKSTFKFIKNHPLGERCNEYLIELVERDIDGVQIIHDALLAKLDEVKESERENALKVIEVMKLEREAKKEADRKVFEEKQKKDDEDFFNELEERMKKFGL